MTTDPASIKLSPCPFCGKQPTSRWYGAIGEDDDSGYWGIDCCRAFAHADSEAEAAALWETRAALAAPSAPAVPAERVMALVAAERERLLNTPELRDFSAGVILEALHQRERWGVETDAGKAPADWFWLVGYLAGKALNAAIAGNQEKALHHTISTAAALSNWHAHILGVDTSMRPGIEPPAEQCAAALEALVPSKESSDG